MAILEDSLAVTIEIRTDSDEDNPKDDFVLKNSEKY